MSSILKRGCLCLLLATMCSCTINIYHAVPNESGTTGNKMLNIPQREIKIKPGDIKKKTILQSSSAESDQQQSDVSNVLSMQIESDESDESVQPMQAIELTIDVGVDAYLNCYYRQADGQILKVFPNRYNPRYWVYAGQQVQVPGGVGFKIVTDSRISPEAFMCLVSTEDVLLDLPKSYQANVFQSIPIENFDALYGLYRRMTAANLLGRVVNIDLL